MAVSSERTTSLFLVPFVEGNWWSCLEHVRPWNSIWLSQLQKLVKMRVSWITQLRLSTTGSWSDHTCLNPLILPCLPISCSHGRLFFFFSIFLLCCNFLAFIHNVDSTMPPPVFFWYCCVLSKLLKALSTHEKSNTSVSRWTDDRAKIMHIALTAAPVEELEITTSFQWLWTDFKVATRSLWSHDFTCPWPASSSWRCGGCYFVSPLSPSLVALNRVSTSQLANQFTAMNYLLTGCFFFLLSFEGATLSLACCLY